MTELCRHIARVALVFAFLLTQTSFPANAEPRDGARDTPRGGAAAEASSGAPESLRRQLDALSPREQRVVKRRLRNMPPQRRARFFKRWESLGEGEREALFERFRTRLDRREAEAVRDGDRAVGFRDRDRADDARRDLQDDGDRVERNRRTWRDMQSGDRERMKKRLRRFKELSPAQQRRVVNRRFKDRTAEERQRILKRLRAASERLD